MTFSHELVSENNGHRYGRMMHPWLSRKEDLIADTPSRQDGMSYEEELVVRQKGGIFIHEIVLHLSCGKGENGLSGVAATLFNRFFKVHSLKNVDYRDVAAACVFLAGKNEDSPKKLKYVATQLWQHKFPHHKHFPSEQTFQDQCDVVTFLESIVLKTIAFDINVDLPHESVFKLMRHVEQGKNVHKELAKSAYFMSTEVLLVTDWSIRYSCAAIATACVNIAAFFRGIRMDDIVPKDLLEDWYKFQDSSLTRAELEAMTSEFLDIYARNPSCHIGSLKTIDPNGKVQMIGQTSNVQQATSSSVTASSLSSDLEKVDLESQEEKQKTPPVSTTDSPPQTSQQDVKDQKVVEQKLKKREEKKKHASSRITKTSSSSHPCHHQNGQDNGMTLSATSTDSPRQIFRPDVKDQKVDNQESVEQKMNKREVGEKHHSSRSSESSSSSLRHHHHLVPSTDVWHQFHLHGHRAEKSHNVPATSDHSNSHHKNRRSLKRPSGQEETNRVKKSHMEHRSSFATTSTNSNSHKRQQMTKTETHKSGSSNGSSGYGRPVPLMSIQMHKRMLAFHSSSTYQRMSVDLGNERHSFTAGTRAGLHHQHISPLESSASIYSTMLLPPPPPPPVVPDDEMEEGELR